MFEKELSGHLSTLLNHEHETMEFLPLFLKTFYLQDFNWLLSSSQPFYIK